MISTPIPKQLQELQFRFIKLGDTGEWLKRPSERGWQLNEIQFTRQKEGFWINNETGEAFRVNPKYRSLDHQNKIIYFGKPQNYSYNDRELIQHINLGGNYGVCGGHGDLFLLDCDQPIISEMIEKHLPKTFKVRDHFYFRCKDADNLKLSGVSPDDSSKETTYGDFQYFGKQVVGPNCKHKSGAFYSIINDVPIAKVEFTKIKQLFRDYIVDTKTAKSREFDSSIETYSSQNKIGNKPVYGIHRAIDQLLSLKDVMNYFGFDTSKYNTNCMMHDSHTKTSFCWDNRTNQWFCHGCHKGGNHITLMRLMGGC